MSRKDKWPSKTTKIEWQLKMEERLKKSALKNAGSHTDVCYDAATLLCLVGKDLTEVGEYAEQKDFRNGYSRGLRLVMIGDLQPDMSIFKVGGLWALEGMTLEDAGEQIADVNFVRGYEAGSKLNSIFNEVNTSTKKR